MSFPTVGTCFPGNTGFTLVDNKSSARFDWSARTATVDLRECARADARAAVVRAVKFVVCMLALEGGGLALHASAIAKDSGSIARGIAFFGPSGAGKSTAASLNQHPWTVVSDDFTVVLPHDSGFSFYASPWSKPCSAPLDPREPVGLERLLLVQKAENNTISDMSPPQQITSVVSSTPTPPYSDAVAKQLLVNAGNLCSHVPVGTLYFSNARPIDYLWK
ncbi:MAG: hypothetical protein GF410_12340 [Chitinivibrionales bacterium]|nr:hypothetical protein [Chitinivibrionales bacterium]